MGRRSDVRKRPYKNNGFVSPNPDTNAIFATGKTFDDYSGRKFEWTVGVYHEGISGFEFDEDGNTVQSEAKKYNVIENTLSDLPINIGLKFITKGIINMNMEYRGRTDEGFCVAYLRKA